MALIPIVFGLLTALWVDAAQGAETREPGRCWREVSFNETRDGSFVIRSAWVCERTEAPKKTEKK
jgi:hypothetical protein